MDAGGPINGGTVIKKVGKEKVEGRGKGGKEEDERNILNNPVLEHFYIEKP